MNATATLLSLLTALFVHVSPHTQTVTVTAEDGTVTVNVVEPGEPVHGEVTLPSGEKFSF